MISQRKSTNILIGLLLVMVSLVGCNPSYETKEKELLKEANQMIDSMSVQELKYLADLDHTGMAKREAKNCGDDKQGLQKLAKTYLDTFTRDIGSNLKANLGRLQAFMEKTKKDMKKIPSKSQEFLEVLIKIVENRMKNYK